MLSKEDKILFVDDELNVLNTIKRNLIGFPMEMFFASSGEEALEILKKETVKVVVSDLRMPGMNGIQLMEIIQKEYPDIVKIVLTGNAQTPNILATINKTNIFKYLIKPWKFEEEFIPSLKQAVQLYDTQKMKNEIVQASEAIVKSGLAENKYLSALAGLVDKSLANVDFIQSNITQLTTTDKEALEKMTLEIYSQAGAIAANLNTVKIIIERYAGPKEKE